MALVTDWPDLVNRDQLAQWSARQCSSLGGERFQATLDDMADLVRRDGLIEPGASYRSYGLLGSGKSTVLLEGGGEITGAPAAAAIMEEADALVAAVATIGGGLEAKVSALFAQNQILNAYALEEIGVAALFELSTSVANLIAAEAKAGGLEASSALFPGNDGFDLAQQRTVFELAEGGAIGMGVTDGAMLHPVKSSSMVFGLGKSMPRWDSTKDCESCKAREKCRYRRQDPAAA